MLLVAFLLAPALPADSGRNYGNDAYMYCCDKRALVHVPGGDWEMADRDVDCEEYLGDHPEARFSVCQQIRAHTPGETGLCSPGINEICCSYGGVCNRLQDIVDRARGAMITLGKHGESYNRDRSIAKTKGLKNDLGKMLRELREQFQKCKDAASEKIVADALDALSGLNGKPETSGDVIRNNEILKAIDGAMLQLAADKCGDSVPDEPCPVPPIPPLSGIDLHDCQTNCRDCQSRDVGGKPAVSKEMNNAIDCLRKRKAGVSSTYRSPAYQKHFWDLYQNYLKLLRNRNPNCAERLAEYSEHMKHHSIVGSVTNPEGESAAMHPKGEAIDISGVSPVEAECCGVYQRYPSGDPVHYERCIPLPCPHADMNRCSGLSTGRGRP